MVCYNGPVNEKGTQIRTDGTAYQSDICALDQQREAAENYGGNSIMRIKKFGALILAGIIMCATPAVPAMASDTSVTVQEIITDNAIDSLASDPDAVVEIIMNVKDAVAQQDISDDQIKSLIQTAESTAGVSLTDEEENKVVEIVKQVKDMDIDEAQLRSTVTKVYDKLQEMGIGKDEVKGILHKLVDLAKSLFN